MSFELSLSFSSRLVSVPGRSAPVASFADCVGGGIRARDTLVQACHPKLGGFAASYGAERFGARIAFLRVDLGLVGKEEDIGHQKPPPNGLAECDMSPPLRYLLS